MEKSTILEGLWDSPKAFLTAKLSDTRDVLLITSGVSEDKLFENLQFFCPGRAIEFPAWETLPGEGIDPSPDIVGKRFDALFRLAKKEGPILLLCPINSLLQKVLPANQMLSLCQTWEVGLSVPFDSLREKLEQLGFQLTAAVSDKGQFALRAGILDIFPVSSQDPYRIGFFGDEIEEIKTFDPISQKSIAKAQSFLLTPANERKMLQKTKELSSILSYLDNPHIFWDDMLASEDVFADLKGAKSPFSIPMQEMLTSFEKYPNTYCTGFHLEESFEMFHHTFHAKFTPHKFHKVEHCFSIDEPIDPKLTITFINQNETEENEIRKKLKNTPLPPNCQWKRGYLHSGFCYENHLYLPNVELTDKSRVRRQKWRNTYHTPAAEFHELTPGDLVVHYHSGIGRYLGMEKQVDHQGKENEFLLIQYAENSKLFVPLSQSHLISRYIGTSESPPSLSELGSKRWIKTKHQAQAQIVGYAHDLLQLYAKRVAHGGFSYPSDSDLMQNFEEDFPYEPTGDQKSAIEAIKNDMMSNEAMDRLICGDVGYGKTEVAMRASFKAVVDGQKQVAVLVPTTVLALQHKENFQKRMSNFPVVIESVSRFQTPKENHQILERVAKGEVDILVGTHRLLSKDVHFKNLGLLVIDEEQRFGVRAKEHLKKLKTGIDCLTLTATPIPRTLYMSLVSVRDMSVINTPPQDRLPIKTIIAETEEEIIQNALLREFARGGQAFFIHNRVETIHQRASKIKELIPNAKIGIVHGQMESHAIDEVFHRFKLGEIDLLFATTIVENGVDIPNANTILIDKAQTYGLSDLYQLRGRVGRWNRAAFAYFLIPKNQTLPEVSRKRLNALVEASGYGGGMKIAMRDLEIRGAGDILGVQQSGQVSSIGFHLYCKMLKRAISALKTKTPVTFVETKMEFSFNAKIPESYIFEVSLRMEIYYRLGSVSSIDELKNILEECEDRFGKAPEPFIWLYHLSRIRLFGSANQFTLLKFNGLSFIAEQQKGKNPIRKTLLLPKKIQTPELLEKHTIDELKQHFSCTAHP